MYYSYANEADKEDNVVDDDMKEYLEMILDEMKNKNDKILNLKKPDLLSFLPQLLLLIVLHSSYNIVHWIGYYSRLI